MFLNAVNSIYSFFSQFKFLLTGNWLRAKPFFLEAHSNAALLSSLFDCIRPAFWTTPWLFLMLIIMSFIMHIFFSHVCILCFLLLSTLFHTDGAHAKACQPDSLSQSSLKITSLSISWSRSLPYALWSKEHIWFLSTKRSFLELVRAFFKAGNLIHSSQKSWKYAKYQPVFFYITLVLAQSFYAPQIPPFTQIWSTSIGSVCLYHFKSCVRSSISVYSQFLNFSIHHLPAPLWNLWSETIRSQFTGSFALLVTIAI